MTARGLCATIVLLCVASVAVATDYCATTAPESVLGCYDAAVAAEDWDALAALTDDGFEKYYRGREKDVVSKDEWIEAQSGLIESGQIKNATTTMGGEYTVAEGKEPDTWELYPVTFTLGFDGRNENGEWEHFFMEKATVSISVAAVGEGEDRHYVITSWVADVDQ